MTPRLDWQKAQPKDATAVQSFQCCFCVRRKRAPWGLSCPYWEHRVQSSIRREMAKNVLGKKSDYMLLGFDGTDLAALSWSYEVSGPSEVSILVAAVATSHRGPGMRYGDELMDQTLQRIMNRADAAGVPTVTVEANIHQKNLRSQRLFQRSGFRKTRAGTVELWQTKSGLPGHPAALVE